MRGAEWKRLAGPILAETAVDWGWARTLAYIRPASWNVHGVLAEASGARQGEFYLWVVRMPLTIPSDGVVDLSWSDRFGGASATYAPGSETARGAIAGAAAAATAAGQSDGLVLAPPGGADNVRMQEARAYGLLLRGDDASALEVLRRVGRYRASYPWEQELLGRAREMAMLIEAGRRNEATGRLRSWRRDNCESLGLTCESTP